MVKLAVKKMTAAEGRVGTVRVKRYVPHRFWLASVVKTENYAFGLRTRARPLGPETQPFSLSANRKGKSTACLIPIRGVATNSGAG